MFTFCHTRIVQQTPGETYCFWERNVIDSRLWYLLPVTDGKQRKTRADEHDPETKLNEYVNNLFLKSNETN